MRRSNRSRPENEGRNGRGEPEGHPPGCRCERCRERLKQEEAQDLLREISGLPAGSRLNRWPDPDPKSSRRRELLRWGALLAAAVLIGAAYYFTR